jgi:hypothetical protein
MVLKWSRNLSNVKKIIDKRNLVLTLLDGLEEQRKLSSIEKYLRRVLKEHTLKILEAKRIYWQRRVKLRWAKLDGENTKKIILWQYKIIEETS